MPRKIIPLFFTFEEMLRAINVKREAFLEQQPHDFPKPNAFGNYSIAEINEWAKNDKSTATKPVSPSEALAKWRLKKQSA